MARSDAPSSSAGPRSSTRSTRPGDAGHRARQRVESDIRVPYAAAWLADHHLHDSDAERTLVILFFDNEDDYQQGDEVLDAMPAGDTPGRRSGVAKYHVAHRMTA